MSDEILEKFTRDYIEAQRVPEVIFAWQGGEPTLMGLEFFQQAIRVQDKYHKPGTKLLNTLQTNGTTLDDDWCEFFKSNEFLVGLSLDGPRHLHDAYRVNKGGQPTFDRVWAGLELLKKHAVEFNILTTVHAANAEAPREVYSFLRDDVGTRFIQFIPIVERKNETGYQEGYKVTKRSVTGKKYGAFLIAVFDEWLQKDVGQVYVQLFDAALGVWYGQPASICTFSETCGTALALEHTGDLYACDHYVEPRYRLGNIQEETIINLIGSEEQASFGRNKYETLPSFCRKCDVRFICNGGCPKNRIRRTPDGEEGLNFLCEGYKAFFTHINEPMRLMVQLLRMGRPPADVSKLLGKNTDPPKRKLSQNRSPQS